MSSININFQQFPEADSLTDR